MGKFVNNDGAMQRLAVEAGDLWVFPLADNLSSHLKIEAATNSSNRGTDGSARWLEVWLWGDAKLLQTSATSHYESNRKEGLVHKQYANVSALADAMEILEHVYVQGDAV